MVEYCDNLFSYYGLQEESIDKADLKLEVETLQNNIKKIDEDLLAFIEPVFSISQKIVR